MLVWLLAVANLSSPILMLKLQIILVIVIVIDMVIVMIIGTMIIMIIIILATANPMVYEHVTVAAYPFRHAFDDVLVYKSARRYGIV